MGSHDDRRVSLFEDPQTAYTLLQDVLMQQDARAGWALGVAEKGKARALAYRLGPVVGSHGGGGNNDDGNQSVDRPYEDVCESWWVEVQRLARGEGDKTRVIEYSFLSDGKVGIWVLSGDTGELLCSKVVSSTGLAGSRGLSIQEALAEARKSMGVQGRDAMREARDALCASTDEPASSVRAMVTPEDSERKKVQSAWEILSELTFKVVVLRHKIDLMVPTLDGRVQNLLQEAQIRVEESHPDKLEKENSIEDLKKRERLLRESLDTLYEVKRELEDQLCQMLLKELYQALIAPVEAALEGAEELLIVPHKTLFQVPWAALTDADGSYLVEWYVIRTAPSLRVAARGTAGGGQDAAARGTAGGGQDAATR